jgi:hypothetical protein
MERYLLILEGVLAGEATKGGIRGDGFCEVCVDMETFEYLLFAFVEFLLDHLEFFL